MILQTFSKSPVFSHVRTWAHKLKILWSIVISNPIEVMYNLFFKQVTTNLLFHHKPMLKHITFPCTIPIRMFRTIQKDISFGSHNSTTFPFRGCFFLPRGLVEKCTTRMATKFTNALIESSPLYIKIFMTKITLKDISKTILFARIFRLNDTLHIPLYVTLNYN